MRALLQRVTSASVSSEGKLLGEIGPGLLVLLGITHDDDEEKAARLVAKTVKLRIFGDEQGKMNRSLLDVDGSLLVISQFTLFANARSGNRPSYSGAARPDHAAPLVDRFVELAREQGVTVETGEFGADMQVSLLNDGPVTILLDTDEL